MSKKEQDLQKKIRAALLEKQSQLDKNPFSIKYQFCVDTFRISKKTDIKSFLKAVCEHWGLSSSDFMFFDDNGDPITEEDTGKGGSLSIEKLMEMNFTKEQKDKDIFAPGPRKAMLYLGSKGFEQKYRKLMTLIREKNEEEKEKLKLAEKIGSTHNDGVV